MLTKSQSDDKKCPYEFAVTFPFMYIDITKYCKIRPLTCNVNVSRLNILTIAAHIDWWVLLLLTYYDVSEVLDIKNNK